MNLENSLAITISAVAVISTVIGPVLTATITCLHESSMYKKRFLTEHEHEAIEKYLHTVGRFAFGEHYDDQKDFGEAISEIFMYAPKELWEDIQNINNDIIVLLATQTRSEKKPYISALQKSYLSLCEKFAPYRRSKKKYKYRRPKKDKS